MKTKEVESFAAQVAEQQAEAGAVLAAASAGMILMMHIAEAAQTHDQGKISAAVAEFSNTMAGAFPDPSQARSQLESVGRRLGIDIAKALTWEGTVQ